MVDRIARETEQVIDDVMPDSARYAYAPESVPYDSSRPETLVDSLISGYIRYVDVSHLLHVAQSYKPVSYTHLDVYKRQVIFPDALMSQLTICA